VLVVTRRNGEMVLQMAFPGVRFQAADHATCQKLQAALVRPFLVRTSSTGNTKGYRFGPGLGASTRRWIRALVSAWRVVAPEAEEAEWAAKEGDGMGWARTEYRAVALEGQMLHVERARLVQHERVPPGETIQAGPEADGRGQACLDGTIRWLRSCRWEDRSYSAIAEADVQLSGWWRSSYQMISHATVPVSALPRVAWDEPWDGAVGSPELDDAEAARNEAEQMRELLAGVTCIELTTKLAELARLDKFDSPEMHEAIEHLAWLVRLRPDTLRELHVLTNEPTTDPKLAALVLNAIGTAGTPAAQVQLGGILGNVNHKEARRVAAAHALFQTAKPTPTVLDGIHAIAAAPHEVPGVAGTSMLLLGALVSGLPEGAPERVQAQSRLLALEGHALRAGLKVDWLEALGNARMVKQAARFLQDEDPEIRAIARRITGQSENEETANKTD